MAIPTQDASNIFTKKVIEVYDDWRSPLGFLRGFFQTVETAAKEVSIEVTRGTEKYAVDILPGSNGNRNTYSKYTEKIFAPPMYDEKSDVTSLEGYDSIRDGNAAIGRLITSVGKDMARNRALIERAYEKQCKEALFGGGIITLKSTDNVDFKRKAGSQVDKGGAGYWVTSNPTVNPLIDLETGAKWLRANGKITGSTLVVILGGEALNAMKSMPLFKDTANLRRVEQILMAKGADTAVGGVPQGIVTSGAFTFTLFTYPETYDEAGVATNYVPDNKVLLIPERPNFKMAFGGTPQVFNMPKGSIFPQAIKSVKGAFATYSQLDMNGMTHVMGVRSRGLAIMTGVDQAYTLQVLA